MRKRRHVKSSHIKGLQMDSINEGEDDRIRNLPDDIIHHIFSFLDLKYAVQTSALSRKWRSIWVSMPRLNLNSGTFGSVHRFSRFVEKALLHRSNEAEVCALELRFTGATTEGFVTHIVNYAYQHRVRQLTVEWVPRICHDMPRYIFSSDTLKHLSLNAAFNTTCVPNSVWNFPALETLNLTQIRFGNGFDTSMDLFNQCIKLKDFTLHECSMYGVQIFSICAPQLVNLAITKTAVFPEVFKVVAPQLTTLTAGGFSSHFEFLHLSTEEGFNSLKKVNLSLLNNTCGRQHHAPHLLDLFKIVSSAKFLILDVNIIESLSLCLDRLSREPCPFNGLKWLKIDTALLKQKDCIPTIPVEVRNYLLGNSPNATLIMDLPPQQLDQSKMEAMYVLGSRLTRN
ncbi:F-box domain, cyclin-like protein [Tanacetum coccineum]